MGLLQEIIEGARTDSRTVGELLRSLQILARRGKISDLADWIVRERDGYSPEDPLPNYRGPHDVRVLAHFSGPFGSEIRDIDIGSYAFPDGFSNAFKVELRQSITAIEDLLKTSLENLSSPWDGNLIGWANGLVEQGQI